MKCSPQPVISLHVEERNCVCPRLADETKAFDLESTLSRTDLTLWIFL